MQKFHLTDCPVFWGQLYVDLRDNNQCTQLVRALLLSLP